MSCCQGIVIDFWNGQSRRLAGSCCMLARELWSAIELYSHVADNARGRVTVFCQSLVPSSLAQLGR